MVRQPVLLRTGDDKDRFVLPRNRETPAASAGADSALNTTKTIEMHPNTIPKSNNPCASFLRFGMVALAATSLHLPAHANGVADKDAENYILFETPEAELSLSVVELETMPPQARAAILASLEQQHGAPEYGTPKATVELSFSTMEASLPNGRSLGAFRETSGKGYMALHAEREAQRHLEA